MWGGGKIRREKGEEKWVWGEASGIEKGGWLQSSTSEKDREKKRTIGELRGRGRKCPFH